MVAYIIRRIFALIPVVFGVTLIVFSLMHIAGDPISLMYGVNVPQKTIDAKREELGLNRPLLVQYFSWVGKAIQGDLGVSLRSNEPVTVIIRRRLGATLELTMSAFFVTLLFSVPTGVISAIKRNSWLDYITRVSALFWISVPYFWLGLVFILLFGVHAHLLPISGRHGPFYTWSGFRSLVLPALTLGLPPLALFTRFLRSSMLEIMHEDYIRTARSKGLRESIVIIKHAVRNALIPFVTLLGLRVPWLFGGAVITETVFAWPGMGRALVTAVLKRDYFVVQGIILMIAVLVVLANLVVDLLYTVIDPRIRYE